jgi:hypothetical protein
LIMSPRGSNAIPGPAVFNAPVLCEPDDAFVPDQAPLAVHEVGEFVAFQVSVAEEPTFTAVGLTDSVTFGRVTVFPVPDLDW